MKNIIITIAAIIISIGSYAQNNDADTLLLFSKLTNEGITLRIMPQKAQTWLLGAENGYDIYRKESGVDKEFKLLTKTPLKPFYGDDYNVFENGNDVKELQQKAIFDNIAKNKLKMSMHERILFVDKLQNEYGFYVLVSTRIKTLAQSSGMEYLDKTAKKNKLYIYKVKIADDNNSSHSTESLITHQTTEISIPDLDPIEMDKEAKLTWMHLKNNNPILCYHIEKSEDGNNFTRITEAPVYPTNMSIDEDDFNKEVFIMDSLNSNYKPYYYRIIGIDMWAEEHTSQSVIKVIGRDKTPPPIVNGISYDINEESKSITYKWNYNAPNDFAGFRFYTSNKLKGQYTLQNIELSSDTIREFTINNAGESDVFYLRIAAFDTANNVSHSLPKFANVPDIYPPSAPTNTSAKIDTVGNMKIIWNANPENDIKGYKVFASNSKNSKMISVTPMLLSDTFYMDTLNIQVLNKYKYFTLMAVDYNFNMSPKSETIKVQLPDVIRPSAGKITSLKIQDSRVIVNWIPSASNDIAKQNILRRKVGIEAWEITATISDTATVYIDSPQEKAAYEYSIEAIDSAGNIGVKSFVFAVEFKNDKAMISIEEFKVKRKNSNVILSWKSSGKQANYYIVYREQKGKSIKRIASVKDMKYTDSTVAKDNIYKYYIVAQDDKGVLHTKSKTKKVSI